MNPIKYTTVFMMLLVSVAAIALIILGINYFDIDPGGIIQSQGEVSFGATSKLGWMLTFVFFVLFLLFSFLRNLFDKTTGRK